MSLNIPSVVDPSERMDLAPFAEYPCSSLHVLDSALVHKGDRTDVYRATPKTPPRPGRKTDVVYKVAYDGAVVKLRNEAEAYRKMSRLQGIRIPLCYGYFVVGPMECLVLDYCGEPLSVPFKDLEWKIKGEVMQAFWSIHRCGVQHKDPLERNVLQDETNKIFVIDFEHASTSHDCKGACPKVSDIAPEAPDYGCAELWNVFTELGIWMPSHVWYGDERVHIELLYEPAELVRRHRPSYWSEEKANIEAWALVKDYAQRYLPTYHARIMELEAEQEAKDKMTLEKAATSKGKNKTTQVKQPSAIRPHRDPDARPQPRTYAS